MTELGRIKDSLRRLQNECNAELVRAHRRELSTIAGELEDLVRVTLVWRSRGRVYDGNDRPQ